MASVDPRLAKRKLDALKRGIHRLPQDQALPFSVNLVGIGKAGADVVTAILRSLPDAGAPFAALVIDIGESDLGALRAALAEVPAGRAEVEIISLPLAREEDLLATMEKYGAFLKLEYPWFQGPVHGKGWLRSSGSDRKGGSGVARAYAKAVYGQAYYDGDRSMRAALRRFGATVTSNDTQPVVAMVFGLGGGTGGGIMVDVARHLSTVVLGRAALTIGVGILPCAGDSPEHRGGQLYACFNELDCLGDESKNEGVVQGCGDLFRNPFTAGFIAIPQQHVWDVTQNLEETHARVDREIVDLLSGRAGANLMEVLRLLNWVAAPSTQHSAARTPWGPKWVHMLGFGDVEGPLSIGPRGPRQFGVSGTYRPEYIETRVAQVGAEANAMAGKLQAAFSPDVPPQLVEGGRAGSVQFVLPCIEKLQLDAFYDARDAYGREAKEQRISDHSMLLEQGVVLSEPSTRLEDMAGASLDGELGWVAVPYAALRGGERPVEARAKLVAV